MGDTISYKQPSTVSGEAQFHFALHAHEMLTRCDTPQSGSQDPRTSKTASFGTSLNLLDSSGEKVLDDANKVSLIALSNVRDSAQHSVVLLSEQEFHLYAQTAVTVFDLLMSAEFDQKLADFLPQRVLPVSTEAPESLELLVDGEVTQIKDLLRPGRNARPKHGLVSGLSSQLTLLQRTSSEHRHRWKWTGQRSASRAAGDGRTSSPISQHSRSTLRGRDRPTP